MTSSTSPFSPLSPAKTRSKTSISKARKQTYRRHLKNSMCRGATKRCLYRWGCKHTKSGKRKSYCRRNTNIHA